MKIATLSVYVEALTATLVTQLQAVSAQMEELSKKYMTIGVEGACTPLGVYNRATREFHVSKGVPMPLLWQGLIQGEIQYSEDNHMGGTAYFQFGRTHEFYPYLLLLVEQYEHDLEEEAHMQAQNNHDNLIEVPETDATPQKTYQMSLQEVFSPRHQFNAMQWSEIIACLDHKQGYSYDELIQAVTKAGYGNYPVMYLTNTLEEIVRSQAALHVHGVVDHAKE